LSRTGRRVAVGFDNTLDAHVDRIACVDPDSVGSGRCCRCRVTGRHRDTCYICRLFAKELVLKNFVGIPQDQLLERLLELTLYTEENLR
jgi:hypothetical protein